MMGLFTIIRAVFVRVLFAVHGLIAIWRLYIVTGNAIYWYSTAALAGLLSETVVTMYKKRGNEWKWFCPSVFFYLLSVVPSIWFLELHEMERRINYKERFNVTGAVTLNDSVAEDLSATIESLGLEIRLPGLKLTSDQWVRTIEQILLLFLILGRWLLPKGKLTHDQLSQLLLVYIGTAADIVEFFDAFKEQEVRFNRLLCQVILSIWSWSLLQFTMVLTATKARKDQSGLIPAAPKPNQPYDHSCCTPDVYGIVISIFMQDAPFLVLRLLLIFKYGVVSYTNMFFTCKNTLVIMLLLYRLVVVQMQRYTARKQNSKYLTMSESSSSHVRLMMHSNSSDPYLLYKPAVSNAHAHSNVGLNSSMRGSDGNPDEEKSGREPEEDEPEVNYIIKRHISMDDLRLTTDDDDEDDDDDDDTDGVENAGADSETSQLQLSNRNSGECLENNQPETGYIKVNMNEDESHV